jgi:hypothetical protein
MFGQFLLFPTSQEATGYVNAMNKTQYNLTSTIYPRGGVYRSASGQAPRIYKAYEWNEGDPFNLSECTYREIEQLNNLVIVTTVKQLST